MNILGVLVLGALVVAIGLVIAGQMGLLTGKVPGGLGVTGGRLKGLSKTPNCVSSQVRSSSRLGQKDFGVNRARIEALRAQLSL